MIAVFATTFPFFALVLCGYVAVRVRLLPLLAIPGLNMFVLYFALPCLLYRFGANTAITQLLDPFVIVLWIACAAIMVAGMIFATRKPFGWNDAAFGALVGAFSNTGFMGVPLLVAPHGARAAGTAILTILVDLGNVLAERFGADNGRIARIILVSTAAAFVTFSGAVALIARCALELSASGVAAARPEERPHRVRHELDP